MPAESIHKIPIQPHLQYIQGPRGDPFAPQPSPSYFPVEVQPSIVGKPAKKRRKPSLVDEIVVESVPDSYIDPAGTDFVASCPAPPPVREVSVASSSQPAEASTVVRSRRKGKARAVVAEESEIDADEAGPPTRSTRRRSLAKVKLPTDTQLKSETEPEPDETIPPGNIRSNKRPRVRLSSPAPPPKPPTIRLRLPPRTKGKERAEDVDESKKGMFDDFLPPDERDTGATAVVHADKQRFDKSRAAADVSIRYYFVFGDSLILSDRRNSCLRRQRLTLLLMTSLLQNPLRGRYVRISRNRPLHPQLLPPLPRYPLLIPKATFEYDTFDSVNSTFRPGLTRRSRKNI